MGFGVEAASYYVPSLYLDIKDLAKHRAIEPEKLQKGLGLLKMALPDAHEDTATFAAEAILKLLQDYSVPPEDISRIYLGTESALDAAKPTATYAMQMVEKALEEKHGKRIFKNCDVVDITFACIGAVDALQNCLDYIRSNPTKKAIVVASDYAKYALTSSGEYTQGAGAVALLVSAEPKLLEINETFGIATEGVFDFFKPRRPTKKEEWKNAGENTPDTLELFTDEPVFDGQYSNQCYQDRIREAYENYKEQTGISKPYKSWKYLIFHLPYAFHGKRVFSEIYGIENNFYFSTPEEQKQLTRTEEYQNFIQEKIEPSQRASSQIGNMYTASIFMALLSALQVSYNEDKNIEGTGIGFFAYGSGSKAKVFAGKVGKGWKEIVSKWNLFEKLNERISVDFETYERLHKKQIKNSINSNYKGFGLKNIDRENSTSLGARYYEYKI
ncbi:MAG: hydroxymethylglutaryl-CoA synthase family protein [Bergeyella sp.]|nr:hydroxymethylglutaryl-CoA synthase family protein [Bergeyella sp.]